MRVLVTGATGFVGGAVASALRQQENGQQKHKIIGIGRSGTCPSNCDEWIQLDLLNDSKLSEIESTQADCLIHCAWDATPGTYWTTPKNLEWVGASLRLLESFRIGGGNRVVIAGTSAEYSWESNQSLNESSTPLEPNTLYGTCKNSLRQIVASWAQTNDMSWAWGRIFCPFGKHEKPQRLIPKLIRRLQEEETFPFDSGGLIRDFLFIDELADAFVALADSDVQGPINLASGCDTTIRQLVTLVAENLGVTHKLQFDTQPDPVGQPPRIVADISRLKNEVNWQTQTTIAKNIASACNWWKTNTAN